MGFISTIPLKFVGSNLIADREETSAKPLRFSAVCQPGSWKRLRPAPHTRSVFPNSDNSLRCFWFCLYKPFLLEECRLLVLAAQRTRAFSRTSDRGGYGDGDRLSLAGFECSSTRSLRATALRDA